MRYNGIMKGNLLIRRLALLTVALVLLAGHFGVEGRSLAEGAEEIWSDTLEVSVSAEPASMAAPVETVVTISLSNEQLLPISDVRVTRLDGTELASAQTLNDRGGVLTCTDLLTPTEEQLASGFIEYHMYYTLGKNLPGEERIDRALFASLEKLPVNAEIAFARTLSARQVQPGDRVDVAYQVENTGNVALCDLEILDESIGEAAREETLAVGERKTFLLSTRPEATVSSEPVLTCRVSGAGETLERHLEPLEITTIPSQWVVSISTDTSSVEAGQSVTLTCRVHNVSGETGQKLRLQDRELGEIVVKPARLSAGQTAVVTRQVRLNRTTAFLCTLSGELEGGRTLSVASNPLTVAVTTPPRRQELTFGARLDERGSQVRLTLNNNGSACLHGVKISESFMGEIRTLAVVAPGETSLEVPVPQDGSQLIFRAEYQDDADGKVSVLANPVTTRSGPQASPYPQTDLDAFSLLRTLQVEDDGMIYGRMIVGAVTLLALLAGLALWRGASGRKRLQRRRTSRERLLRKRMDASAQTDEPPPPGPSISATSAATAAVLQPGSESAGPAPSATAESPQPDPAAPPTPAPESVRKPDESQEDDESYPEALWPRPRSLSGVLRIKRKP